MATTNDLKNGMVLNLDGQLWQVIWFQHHKPGKGGAVVRTKLKNVESGKTVDRTFNADVKVDVANVDKRTMQYLYNDGTSYVFMDTGTYDQIEITPEIVGDAQELPAGEPGRRSSPPTRVACSTSSSPPRSSSRSPTPSPAWSATAATGRTKPATARDRPRDPGAAVHHHRREGQGRHPRLVVPRPREVLTSAARTDVRPLEGPQARARHPLRRRDARQVPVAALDGAIADGEGPTNPYTDDPGPRRHRAPRAHRRAALDVLRGLDARPDAGRRPQRAADRRLRAALRRRRARRGRGQRGASPWCATCPPTTRRPSSTACSAAIAARPRVAHPLG